MQFHDIRMISKRLQEYNLPESPLRVRLISERIENLLYGHNIFTLLVYRLPDYPVGAFAQPLLYIESFKYVLVDFRHVFLRTFLRHFLNILLFLIPLSIRDVLTHFRTALDYWKTQLQNDNIRAK